MNARFLTLVPMVFFLLAAEHANSLSCGFPTTCDKDPECRLAKELNRADSVFVGVVLSAVEIPPEQHEGEKYEAVRPFWGPERGKRLSFRLIKTWKGTPSQGDHIVTWFDGPTLEAMEFTVGESYIVFASEYDGIGLVTGSSCNTTTVSLKRKNAAKLVRILDDLSAEK